MQLTMFIMALFIVYNTYNDKIQNGSSYKTKVGVTKLGGKYKFQLTNCNLKLLKYIL